MKKQQQQQQKWRFSRHLQKLFVCFLLLPYFFLGFIGFMWPTLVTCFCCCQIDRSTNNECNEVSSIKICSLANYQYGCEGACVCVIFRRWESFGFDFVHIKHKFMTSLRALRNRYVNLLDLEFPSPGWVRFISSGYYKRFYWTWWRLFWRQFRKS